MATDPQFTGTINSKHSNISVANPNLDGLTGTYSDVFVASGNGSRLEQLVIKANVTTTAGIIRLFLLEGASAILLDEILVTALTPSATAVAFKKTVSLGAEGYLTLTSTQKIIASTEKAESFDLFAMGGDY